MSDEEYRHECEVRHLIVQAKEKGRAWVVGYLEHKNVAARSVRLRKDLNEQIRLGNQGERGTWLTEKP